MQILSLLCLVKNQALKKTLVSVHLQVLSWTCPCKEPILFPSHLVERGSACSSHHKGDSLVTFGKQLIHKRGQMTSVLTGCVNSSL